MVASLDQLPPAGDALYSTILPSGSASGHRGSVSFGRRPVAIVIAPPSADTRNNPAPGRTRPGAFGAKRIVPSASQPAPSVPFTIEQMVNGAPPAIEIFFNFRSAAKPTHCPPGEKNGPSAPSVPASGLLSNRSIGRKKI